MNIFRYTILLLLLLSVGVPTISYSESSNTINLASLNDLLSDGNYEEVIKQLSDADKNDQEIRFLLAQANYAVSNFMEAAYYYELMLEDNTNLPRVRLELARTLMSMGKVKNAKEQFDQVLDGNIPPAVQKNIQQFLEKINDRKKWGGVLSVGYMYDSNINSAPEDPNIEAFGLPFVLSDDSTEKDGSVFQSSLSIGRFFDAPLADEWRFDTYGNFSNYFSEDIYDSSSLGFSVGPNFYGKFQWRFPVGYRLGWEDNQKAQESVSFNPSVGIPISTKARLNIRFSLQNINGLKDNDTSNGISRGISMNAQYNLSKKTLFELGLSHTNNNASSLSYDRYESNALSAGYYGALPLNILFNFQPSFSVNKYDSCDPVDNGKIRKDKKLSLSVNIYKNIGVMGKVITPVIGYTYTHNESNISRRDYERNLVSFDVRVQF